ncbi:MAG: AAA family ATPase [Planctomycetota bacterium]
MTYWRYWELSSAPFTGDSKQPLFRGATVEEALARVDFLVGNRRSLGLLSGPGGCGKSSVLRYLAATPPVSAEVPSVSCLRLSMLGLRSGELTSHLTRALLSQTNTGCGCDQDRQGLLEWQSLSDYFNAAAREGVQTLLLLDDAEAATAAAETDLCRLLAATFPLTVILSTASESAVTLQRSLVERVELQIDLPEWELSQTAAFIAWSLARVEGKREVFSDEAVDHIQQISSGIPRRIVQIADLALVAGAVAQADQITAETVQQVVLELPKSFAA